MARCSPSDTVLHTRCALYSCNWFRIVNRPSRDVVNGKSTNRNRYFRVDVCFLFHWQLRLLQTIMTCCMKSHLQSFMGLYCHYNCSLPLHESNCFKPCACCLVLSCSTYASSSKAYQNWRGTEEKWNHVSSTVAILSCDLSWYIVTFLHYVLFYIVSLTCQQMLCDANTGTRILPYIEQ